jgi:putative Mg2+ transporter-C (MgtC) family protein
MTEIWNAIFTSIRADFGDLPSVAEVTQVVVRLTLAALLGGLLGFEREQAGKAAGIRTHMLVALGSAFFVLIPVQAGIGGGDLSRVLQGVITGVGFLGAGTILKGSHKGQIYGLTTAAGIWFTAAVGIAAGLGREATALLGTILAFLILTVVPHVVSKHPQDENGNDDQTNAE